MEKMKRMALKAELAPTRETRPSINFHPRNTRFHSNNTYSNLQPRNTRFDSNPVLPNPQQFNNRFDSNRKSSNFEPLNNQFTSATPIEKQNTDKMKCSLCDGNHWASNCTKYATPDEKLKQLRSKNYCTRCSRSNHETKNCLSKIACRICNGNHFDYLCKDVKGSNKSSAFISVEKRQGILMTKDITVINPITKEAADTVVIFDSGSQQSYVSDRIIQQLKLGKVSKEKINVVGFGAKASSYMSTLVKLQIKTEKCHKEIFANSTKSIATAVPVLYAKCSDSNDIKIVYKTPEILIGMDYFFEFINSFEKAENGNYIVNSCVGKMICKYIPKYDKTTVTSLAVAPSPELIEPDNELKKFWNLEDLGIKDTKENEEESIILEKFKQSVKFENNRYYVSWPEKENHAKLPTNAGLALGRLNSTFKRLSNDPKLLKDCGNIINEQKERETIEVAPEKPDGKLIHYLSSHAVITPQKTTTKVRMVFDASAKISKDFPSLNDVLIRGPLNMPDLGGILLRIRRGKYMLVGDIEKAFHQIYLNKTARDAVRFFWAKDPAKPLTKENLIVYRFIGVPFGVISSPFILWIIILLHLQKLDNEKLRNITENFYVDNIFLLTDEKDEGIEQYKTLREHFLKASMNIRE
uniref:Reverse transcriptase domain-containing protein n=1 Tax=Panagrolaimus sp. PS1159 TaxID=55785 RepID=A0AC35GNG9_9BILA